MNDKIDIKRIFRVDQSANYDSLALIWPVIAGSAPNLDLDIAAKIMDRTVGNQLRHVPSVVDFEGRPYMANVYHDSATGKAQDSVTFFAPLEAKGDQIIERAPIAMNKSETLDFAMLVNFGCCSKAALSLVAMLHINGKLYVVQKDATNVEHHKDKFFETLFTRQMETATGSHVAMHAIGQKHDCARHRHDAFKPS